LALPFPKVMGLPYEEVLLAELLPRATYVFADLERLTLWERMLAADVFRTLHAEGCRCLNDPVKVKGRYPLLRALHQAGIETLASAFAIGCVDYGRADHALVAGRQVVYEINTNPNLLPGMPQTRPIRDETVRIARERFADGLRAIDGLCGKPIRVSGGRRAERQRHHSTALAMQFRP
jgi:hypothetical protein